jgi:diguanylate cyclase (GGDEF)-like protein
MKYLINLIRNFLSGFKIQRPEDFKLHTVRLFRVLGIPVLGYFAIADFLNGELDEAIFNLILLTAFIFSTRTDINPKISKIIYRVVVGLLAGNFIYVIATNPETYLVSMWMYLIPLPAALLFGVAEGMLWIVVSGVAAVLALSSSAGHDPVSTTYITRFGIIYLILGILSLAAEFVRKNTQDLYLNKQKELSDFNENISGKVMLDSLTGAYNRSFLTELLPGLLQFAHDGETPLTVLLCDIDQFKQVNDTYGHVHGDHVLKSAAELFMRNLRSATDNLVRYGGDEFLIVLRNAKLENAARLAERLRVKIENLNFQDSNLKITCSFGVAELTASDFEEDKKTASVQLIARADKCLYQAKHQGKNQVVAHSSHE